MADVEVMGRPSPVGRWVEDHLRLAASVASAGVVIGAVIASFGFKVYGPGARVDQLAVRASVTDSVLAQHSRRLDRLENSDHFTAYLLCVVLRRSDPTAVPAECGPIVQARSTP